MGKIYTKTGDKGTTGLLGGKRIHKSDSLVDLLGTMDEASSAMGIVRASGNIPREHNVLIRRCQEQFLRLGALAAGAKPETIDFNTVREVKILEDAIDVMTKSLKPLSAFIIVGDGGKDEALAHWARSIIRKAERQWAKHYATNTESMTYIAYLNRLSDYFFTLGRCLDTRNQ